MYSTLYISLCPSPDHNSPITNRLWALLAPKYTQNILPAPIMASSTIDKSTPGTSTAESTPSTSTANQSAPQESATAAPDAGTSSASQSAPQESATTAPEPSTSGTSQTTTAAVPALPNNSALHEDLPALVDDEAHNNFPEWHLKVYILLRMWGLLKYIEGPESTLPNIPVLRESVTTTGLNDDNQL